MNRISVPCRVIIAALLTMLIVSIGSSYTCSAYYAHDCDAERALNNCIAYCDGRDFDTALDGKVKARVFGIPYTQSVTGGRSVRGGDCHDTAESSSAFVKAAIKKEYVGGRYFVTLGDYKKKRFVYGEPQEMNAAEYIASYGKPCVGLVKYELGGAVIESKCLGNGEYEFELDPSRATAYCRNEIKAALKSKSYPEYESVTLHLVADGEKPIKVTVTEKLRVEKFGGTFVTAEYTETFDFTK